VLLVLGVAPFSIFFLSLFLMAGQPWAALDWGSGCEWTVDHPLSKGRHWLRPALSWHGFSDAFFYV
jgi:hypothetical protein